MDPSILAFALSAKVSECNAADPIENVQHFSLLLEITLLQFVIRWTFLWSLSCVICDIAILSALRALWFVSRSLLNFVSLEKGFIHELILLEPTEADLTIFFF